MSRYSECLTGDALGSRRCDCGQQYEAAMKQIAHEGRGVFGHMRQEGRGIGLINKLKLCSAGRGNGHRRSQYRPRFST